MLKMARKKEIYFEYSDDSCLIATIENGKVIACPEIKVSEEQGNGLTVDGAIEFLNNIKKAKEETLDKVAPPFGFNSEIRID